MLLDILTIVVVLFTVAIVVTAISHFWIAVPFVPTPHGVAEAMVTMAKLRGDETVFDLGAGDARLLIAAKQRHPSITAIGCELVPTVWLLGKLRIWFSGQDVTFHMRNILRQDVSNADCIFLYLIPSLMGKLEEKFQRELRPGTKIISYAFSFPGRKPVQEQDAPWLGSIRKLRLYEW